MNTQNIYKDINGMKTLATRALDWSMLDTLKEMTDLIGELKEELKDLRQEINESKETASQSDDDEVGV